MAKNQSWFRAEKAANDAADISIYSEIGGYGISLQDFAMALKALGNPKTLRLSISSDGGDVAVGFGIYNMLQRHPANKIVTVDGLAASMASVIAMAGNEVVMPSNSMMMIHNPWGGVQGQAQEIISFGEALNKMRVSIAEAYKAKTGLSRGDILAMMDKETWLSAKEAVAMNFADTVERAVAYNARRFNVSKFHHVPKLFGHNVKGASMTSKTNATDFEGDDGETPAVKTVAEIRAELLATQAEIRALVRISGRDSKLADDFIAKDMSVPAVIAALAKLKDADADADAEKKTDSHIPGGSGADTGKGSTPDLDTRKVYAHWNSAGRNKRA